MQPNARAGAPRVYVDRDVWRSDHFFNRQRQQVTGAPAARRSATVWSAPDYACQAEPSLGPRPMKARFDGRHCAQNIWRENNYQSWWGMITALAGALVSGYLIRSAWVRTASGGAPCCR